MAAHNGLTAYFKRIVETLFAAVAEVYHNTVAVHFLDYFNAKLAHAAVKVAPSCRIADVVVAVMAQCDVRYTTLCEVFHVGKVTFQSQTVFNSKHNALASLSFVFVKVGRSARNTEVATVFFYYFLYLVED